VPRDKLERAIRELEANGFHITAAQLREILARFEREQEKKSR
jgi:hypothetical protein